MPVLPGVKSTAMDITQIWDGLQEQWWWIHALLVGLCFGGSLGIWAYREVWYGLSTFFSSPVETRSPFRALVQWLASFLMLLRSGISVALILTWPTVLRRLTEPTHRWIAVGIGCRGLGAVAIDTRLRQRQKARAAEVLQAAVSLGVLPVGANARFPRHRLVGCVFGGGVAHRPGPDLV